ncbi:MAG: hypothetical protein V1908_04675 [Candidatus Peregrinibacteria bacterium]
MTPTLPIMVTAQFDIIDIANLAVAIAIILAGVLSVFYIFVGGISFILSGGQEEKIKQAVHTIRYAIIGLIVTILSVTIIKIVGLIFGFDLLSVITWQKISVLMNDLVNKIVGSGNTGGGTSSYPGGSSLR